MFTKTTLPNNKMMTKSKMTNSKDMGEKLRKKSTNPRSLKRLRHRLLVKIVGNVYNSQNDLDIL